MPRPVDTTLEKRLLEAARILWRSGETELTMRALARAAKTHAPGIYSRFRDRQDILRILLAEFEEEFAAYVTTAESVEAATELYLGFAIDHPKEYQALLTQRGAMSNKATFSADDIGPIFQWLRDKLSESLVLECGENTKLSLAIWMLWRGTAALLAQGRASSPLADSARSAAKCGVKLLMEEARCKYRPQAEGIAPLFSSLET
jgi:AcrR family transcriptional regulator